MATVIVFFKFYFLIIMKHSNSLMAFLYILSLGWSSHPYVPSALAHPYSSPCPYTLLLPVFAFPLLVTGISSYPPIFTLTVSLRNWTPLLLQHCPHLGVKLWLNFTSERKLFYGILLWSSREGSRHLSRRALSFPLLLSAAAIEYRQDS